MITEFEQNSQKFYRSVKPVKGLVESGGVTDDSEASSSLKHPQKLLPQRVRRRRGGFGGFEVSSSEPEPTRVFDQLPPATFPALISLHKYLTRKMISPVITTWATGTMVVIPRRAEAEACRCDGIIEASSLLTSAVTFLIISLGHIYVQKN